MDQFWDLLIGFSSCHDAAYWETERKSCAFINANKQPSKSGQKVVKISHFGPLFGPFLATSGEVARNVWDNAASEKVTFLVV